ncbi:hypothetical protein J2T08_006122 [Neorhizobium galegae]|uniref:hypothetical protein n=1 Tax=Neorhizobium galegae TaxID=399 RepID=UPI001AEBA4FD|nr:hypothetical protein [Neorhizobium galegae]MBP2562355.1 hypothetical protein [Neorhizobium galegae]MDQ0138177.1 hypothetical protein [Neorhizobium galegae]
MLEAGAEKAEEGSRGAIVSRRQCREASRSAGRRPGLTWATVPFWLSLRAQQVGVALGPGLLVQYNSPDVLKSNLQSFLKVIEEGGKPQPASSLTATASYSIMRDTKSLEWLLRYEGFDQLNAADIKQREERQKTGAPFNPTTDPTFRKLLRVDATVISKDPDAADRKLMVNEPRSRHVGPAVHVQTQRMAGTSFST